MKDEYRSKFKKITTKEHMKTVLDQMKISYSESNLEKIYDKLQDSGSIKEFFTCKRKNKITTAWEATKYSYHMEEFRRGKEYFPYKCPYCNFYHSGSRVEGRDYKNDIG